METDRIIMRKYFNTEGICYPDRHYMVCLDKRIAQIKKKYVDRGSYFVINAGRQCGKTTTLHFLAEFLRTDYFVISMDFQKISSVNFANEHAFSKSFSDMFSDTMRRESDDFCLQLDELDNMSEKKSFNLEDLFKHLSIICAASAKPIVVIIDEVDNASNNRVFLDFLSIMRGYYLDRAGSPFFHSVILAGVHDIKNLKLRIRNESEHQYNSPWNIAAKYTIPINFTKSQILTMLKEYDLDHNVGMSVNSVADCIYEYTGGYPYLVSAICKIMDEELPSLFSHKNNKDIWNKSGVKAAVHVLLNETSTLFDSMAKQLDTYSDLKMIMEQIIYQGKQINFSPYVRSVNLGMMFGFLKEDNGRVAIANRIFEMQMLNMFITEEASKSEAFRIGDRDKNDFIKNGRLDMRLVLEKFARHFNDIYGDNDNRFVEEYGRKFFLLYLKPIINGTGNYYIEAQTRDAKRTDVIVDYGGEQFIIEMKIWHGNEYNERGEAQLMDYLNYFHKKTGYMISFNFNKNKEIGVKEVIVKNKKIIEAVV